MQTRPDLAPLFRGFLSSPEPQRNRFGRALLLLGAILCPIPSYSEATPIVFDHLEVEDGLSQGTVTSIVQDAAGFMWFGTQEGLNRYDGHRFVVYTHNPRDATSLPDVSVTALAATPEGDVWIGTHKGLARWHSATDTLSRFSQQPLDNLGSPELHIRALLHDQRHSLWIGTESQGLHHFDTSNATFRHFPLQTSDGRAVVDDQGHAKTVSVLALFEDHNGRIWVGSRQGLAYVDMQQQRLVQLELPQSVEVRSLGEDTERRLWVGTSSGLFILDSEPSRLLSKPLLSDALTGATTSNDLIRAQRRDRQGRLWIGTDEGLVLIEEGTMQRFRHQSHQTTGLSGSRITAIYQDQSGVLWIANHGGVCRYQKPPFRHILRTDDNPTQLSNNSVLPFSQGSDGALWVGTLGGGLNRMDPASGRFRHLRHDPEATNSLSSDHISALRHDHQDRLWIGTLRDGLCQRSQHGDSFTCFAHDAEDPASLSSNKVATIFEDQQNHLWIGTMGGGLNRWLGEGRFKRYQHQKSDPQSLGNDNISTIGSSNERWLWIGTLGGGLNRFDRTRGTFQQFRAAPDTEGPSHDAISSLLFDAKRQVLWVGTLGGGLNRLDQPNASAGPSRWSSYDRSHGMVSHTVNGLALDRQEQLWLSTNKGLSRFDPDLQTFVHFNTSHGLQDLDFTMGSAYQNEADEIFFGGGKGFNIIRLEDFNHQEARPPPLVLTNISRFNRPLPLPRSSFNLDTLTLAHNDHFLAFEVAALDFAAPQKNTYRYRLLGFDPGWVELGRTSTIRFARLESGNYTLEVQAANSNGVWNRKGIQLDIQVRPPWWRTSLAYGLYALVVLLGGWRIVHRQQSKILREQAVNHQLLEVNRLKDEFLANTSHELRTPLHGITGLAESLLEGDAGEVSEMARESLKMIIGSGHRLSGLVDDILDFQRLRHEGMHIHLRPTHLRPLVHLSLTLTKPLVAGKSIELINRLPLGLPPVMADENRVKQILINLIGNAIKFTHQGSITVSARIHDDRLVIEVADTGIGIPKAKLKTIFEPFEQADGSSSRSYQGTGLGLTICRQLVNLMQGQLWVDSSLGQGSTFSFSLPKTTGPPPSPATESKESFRHLSDEIDTLRREAAIQKPLNGDSTEPQEQGARILVVDDESVNRQVLRNYLSQEHHGLTFAEHGEAALQLIADQTFDLILLDVMMPQMSGYEVCRILRTEYSLQELPIIFLTAKGQEADIMEGMGAGANDYITKPISRGELLSRIRPHLQLVEIYRQLGANVENKVTQIRILRGLLPICAQCKKIRDDDDQWQHFESYLDQNSEAQFSHSICPGCAEDLYPGFVHQS